MTTQNNPESAKQDDRLYEGRVCCLCGANEWEPGQPFVQDVGKLGEHRKNAGCLVCRACCKDDPLGLAADRLDAEITRRCALANPPAVEYYESMPSELPETLPDGVLCDRGYAHFGVRLREDTRVHYDYERAEKNGRALGKACLRAETIDWKTVPKPSRPAREAESAPAPAGSVESATREDAATGARKDAGVFGSTQPTGAPETGRRLHARQGNRERHRELVGDDRVRRSPRGAWRDSVRSAASELLNPGASLREEERMTPSTLANLRALSAAATRIEYFRRLLSLATPRPWEWTETYEGSDKPMQGAYLGKTLITLGDTYEGYEYDCRLVREAVEALPELLSALESATAWIPASERMPEPTDEGDPGRFCLVVIDKPGDEDGPTVGTSWWSPALKRGFTMMHVTHWRELPLLPEPSR